MGKETCEIHYVKVSSKALRFNHWGKVAAPMECRNAEEGGTANKKIKKHPVLVSYKWVDGKAGEGTKRGGPSGVTRYSSQPSSNARPNHL